MENIFAAIFLLLLQASGKDKKLLEIVAIGCIASDVVFLAVDDCAMYYSTMAALAATLAMKCVKLECAAAKIYSWLMMLQATLCALLIHSFSASFNNIIQHELEFYNEWILTVIIVSCVFGTDNLISKRFYESSSCR